MATSRILSRHVLRHCALRPTTDAALAVTKQSCARPGLHQFSHSAKCGNKSSTFASLFAPRRAEKPFSGRTAWAIGSVATVSSIAGMAMGASGVSYLWYRSENGLTKKVIDECMGDVPKILDQSHHSKECQDNKPACNGKYEEFKAKVVLFFVALVCIGSVIVAADTGISAEGFKKEDMVNMKVSKTTSATEPLTKGEIREQLVMHQKGLNNLSKKESRRFEELEHKESKAYWDRRIEEFDAETD